MTISASGVSHHKGRPTSVESSSHQDLKMSDGEEFDSGDLALDLSEFDDGPEEELMKLQDDALLETANSDWFLRPVHRTISSPLDIGKIAYKQPLKAAVLSSNLEGNVTSDPNENIRKTPISQFDLSLFRQAEEGMLSSRTISAMATPYQEELARLKLERLRLEEERLLKRKCLEELEKIRGPKPRWYELKTPDFHYEAKRNNTILSLSGHYREIMEYREQLLSSLGEEKIGAS